jgi:hypothetical protein
MSDWKLETGLTSPKTKEIWELTGRCEKDCCFAPRSGMSQHQRRMQTNHSCKFWKGFYMRQMEDNVFRHAVGFDTFIESVKDGNLLDNPQCPYEAARQYRQSEGLLHAIFDYFGLSTEALISHVKKLRSNAFLDKHDEWWGL